MNVSSVSTTQQGFTVSDVCPATTATLWQFLTETVLVRYAIQTRPAKLYIPFFVLDELPQNYEHAAVSATLTDCLYLDARKLLVLGILYNY